MNKKHIWLTVALIVLVITGIGVYQRYSDTSDSPDPALGGDNATEIANPTFAPDQALYELRADGYGPVQIGMSVKEAAEALKMPLASNSPDSDEASCFYVYPHGEPGTVGFMIREGKIARVDVHFENPDIQTDKKIRFGSSTKDVQAAYSNVRIEAHPYGGPNEKYLIYEDGEHQIIFETDQNGNVTSLRSGKKPEVEFIEGCS